MPSKRSIPERLLSGDLLGRLDRLKFVSKRAHPGQSRGERKSPRRGASAEFCDYRPYEMGDDLRYVDWNLFGRLDRLYLKLFVDEEDLSVHILLDASTSMAFGSPSKIRYGARLAAALGYIGLTSLERVTIGVMRDRIVSGRPAARGRSQFFPLLRFLEELPTQGKTGLNGALQDYARRSLEPGLAIILSDLLDPDGFTSGLDALLERRFDVHIIHLLSDEEMEPALLGDFRLIDAESSEARRLTVDQETLKDYRDRLRAFLDETEANCLTHQVGYHRVVTTEPLEDFILLRLQGHLLQ